MTRIAPKATRGKGKRIPRGQSCASNPQIKKHRNKVAQLINGNSSNISDKSDPFALALKSKLTRENLEKFDAIRSREQHISEGLENWIQDNNHNNENSDANCAGKFSKEDAFSVGNVSAVSIWTNCTNHSFNQFLNGFDPKSKIHKEMLSVLATVRDAIELQKGSETETEYFSGLMLTLNCVDSEEKLTATLALLRIVLKRVPVPVLRLKFSETSSALLKILSQQLNSTNPNGYLTKSIIDSLHTLLINQELAVWEAKSTHQIFDTILLFVIHSKPKIRKTASMAVISLIVDGETLPYSHIPSKLTAEFCIRKLEDHLATTNEEDLNIILYIFTLLSQIMSHFPSLTYTKQASEAILSHMTLGNVLLVTGGFYAFYSIFLQRPKSNVMSSELNARLLNALYDYQPNMNDDQPLNAWCACIKEALLSLSNLDKKLFYLHVPKFIKTNILCLQSESPVVHNNICNCIKSIMKVLLEENNQTKNSQPDNEDYDNFLVKLFSELETSLKYQYSQAWKVAIPMFGEIFFPNEKLNATFGSIMQRMAIIYESNDTEVNEIIERFFIKIIQSHGPRFVLNYCPIVWKMEKSFSNMVDQYNESEFKGEFSNAWLLPILREYTKDHSELSLFVDRFLPMADELSKKVILCQNMVKKLKQSNVENMDIDDPSSSKSSQSQESCLLMIKELQRCIHALWSLLPAFCRNPIDIPSTFPKIARRIGETLYHQELSIYSLAALRSLMRCDESIQKEVGKFANNFLPILFNVYTNENENTRINQGLRLPVLSLIKSFIHLLFSRPDTSASINTFKTLYVRLQSRIQETNSSEFRRHALLDILSAFLLAPKGFTEADIENIYGQVAQPLISDSKSPSDQKKGFRIIEEIIMSDSPACVSFVNNNLEVIIEYIFSLIEQSQSIKSPSTRAFVLRTMRRIIEKSLLNNEKIPKEINWIKLLEELLPLVLYNLVVKAAKTKRCARETLLTISESYEKIDQTDDQQQQQPSLKLISKIINPLKDNLKMDHLEKTSRLDALAFLFVQKYYHPFVSEMILTEIADTILSCLSNAESTRAMLDICFEFIRHFFNNVPSAVFDQYIEVITCGITNLPEEHRAKYRSKIKILLTKLCRKFGFELIKSMVPEDYHKVMKNIRKIEDRKKKKKDDATTLIDEQSDKKSMRSRKSRKSKMTTFSDDDEEDVEKFVNDEFDENNDDSENDDRVSQRSFQSRKSLPLDLASRLSNVSLKNYIREDVDGDPLDLLSSNANKSVFSKIPKKFHEQIENDKKNSNKLPFAKDGRLNIGELLDQLEGPKKGKKRSRDDEGDNDFHSDDSDDSDDQFESKSYKPGGKGIHRPVSIKGSIKDSKSIVSKQSKKSLKSTKSKTNKSSKMGGDVYRSKRASGDMKRRGMPDPYAYYPLNAMSLNKRKALKHQGEFKSIVKGACKGASKGRHLRNKRQKKF